MFISKQFDLKNTVSTKNVSLNITLMNVTFSNNINSFLNECFFFFFVLLHF